MSKTCGIAFALLGGLALAACGGESKPAPAAPNGVLYFSQDNNPNGLFVVNQTTGAATLAGDGHTGVTSNTVGLTEGYGGILHGSTWSNIARIQPDGSGATVLPGSEGVEGLAWDPASGLLYGSINTNFFTLDAATGLRIATLPNAPADVEGLAADSSRNVIYGIGNSTNLYKYDIATATWSAVGDTGINWYLGGLALDPVARVLYAVGKGGNGNLYKIDPITAVPTLVGPLGISGVVNGGLAFVPTPPAPKGGVLYFSQDSNGSGLFSLNQATGAATKVGAGTTGVTTATVGLDAGPGGTLLASSPWAIERIAKDGSGATVFPGSEAAEGLAWNAANGVLYGVINGGFFSMHAGTGVRIATLPNAPADVEGLAADASHNVIYGIGDATNLYKYDIASATWTTVGNTGINWDQGGLAFDPDLRVLYAVGEGGGASLYKINPDTAAPAVVGPLGISGVANGGLAFVPN